MNTHDFKTTIIDTLALHRLGLARAFDARVFAEQHDVTEHDVQTALQELRSAGDIDGHRRPGTLYVSPFLTQSARWRWSLSGAKDHLPEFDAQALKVHEYLREQHQATASQVQELLGTTQEETQRYLTLMKWGDSVNANVHPDGVIANIIRK